MIQWPYSYEACDVGTLPNQTYPGTATPLAAVQNGDFRNNDMLVSGRGGGPICNQKCVSGMLSGALG